MRALLCSLLATCVVGQAAALGREVGYGEAREQFASLRQVLDCGSWKIGENHGDLRLLRYSQYGQDLIFVDRIAPDQAGALWRVEQGYGFAEVNNDHAELSFARLRCSSDGATRVTVEGLAENGHEQSDWQIRIDLNLESGAYNYDASPAE
ncbi:hypothetical protein [Pseudomonas sp. F(2018)]|uniref:hypothetical protein n=1 Tax=Pseudomonas sp. F(2018) TaxID=2502240 RepID=UPI0010F7D83C|nr:hypothetical protein [Pseudomonas sp. F(2018)]